MGQFKSASSQGGDYTEQGYSLPGNSPTYANTPHAMPYYDRPYADYGRTASDLSTSVQTPEGLYRIAPRNLCIASAIVDFACISILTVTPIAFGVLAGQPVPAFTPVDCGPGCEYLMSNDGGNFRNPLLFGIFLVLAVVLFMSYLVWARVHNATFGKKLVGLRNVRGYSAIPRSGRETVRAFIVKAQD